MKDAIRMRQCGGTCIAIKEIIKVLKQKEMKE